MSFYLSDNQDPWSKPGQNKSEQENNGSEPQEPKQQNNQQPPDLEEVFSSLLRKMGGKIKMGILSLLLWVSLFLPLLL